MIVAMPATRPRRPLAGRYRIDTRLAGCGRVLDAVDARSGARVRLVLVDDVPEATFTAFRQRWEDVRRSGLPLAPLLDAFALPGARALVLPSPPPLRRRPGPADRGAVRVLAAALVERGLSLRRLPPGALRIGDD